MIYIYRAIYSFLKLLLLIFQPLTSAKTKHWMKLRNQQNYLQLDKKNVIWFHASSGELEYCKSVITEIRKQSPEMPLVVSYSSPSAEKLLFNIQTQVDLIFPLPWDQAQNLKKAIDHLQPQIVIFARTDFWPEFIFQLEQKNIKMAAISMFPQFNFLNRLSYTWLLKKFSLLTTVNLTKSAELSDLLHRDVLTLPDTRFDQVFQRLATPSRLGFSKENAKKKIVFASTWPEDEAQIFPVLKEILKKDDQIILCPHEVSRTPDILAQLKDFQTLILSELSDVQNISNQFDILVIDKVGFLADVYRFTDLAFIGGSFKKRIHSVMEALCSKNVVFFGPCFNNNPEALETEKSGLTFKVRNSREILDFIRSQTPDQLQKNQEISQEYAEKHKGSSILTAQEILKQI